MSNVCTSCGFAGTSTDSARRFGVESGTCTAEMFACTRGRLRAARHGCARRARVGLRPANSRMSAPRVAARTRETLRDANGEWSRAEQPDEEARSPQPQRARQLGSHGRAQSRLTIECWQRLIALQPCFAVCCGNDWRGAQRAGLLASEDRDRLKGRDS